jgi:hypothetical protein
MINPTATTAISDGGQGAVPAGGVLVYPGIYNSYLFGIARFTAPQTGSYLLQTSAHSYLNGNLSNDSELHVLKNGSALFDQFIAANGSASYTTTLNLAAGDVVDFAIGRGLNGDGNFSGQILSATLTVVPEPSTFVLACVCAAILLVRRRASRLAPNK